MCVCVCVYINVYNIHVFVLEYLLQHKAKASSEENII